MHFFIADGQVVLTMNTVLSRNYVGRLFFGSTKRKKNHKNAQAQNDFAVRLL